MAQPTGRYRVALQTVMGQTWFDVYSFNEAVRRARRERQAGARNVAVLKEYESDDQFVADFRRVWP